MKVWVVNEMTCAGYECEALPTFVGVAATALDALGLIDDGREHRLHSSYIGVRFVIDPDVSFFDVIPGPNDHYVQKQTGSYHARTGEEMWSHGQTWLVQEVELVGFDREAMLLALEQYDNATGRRVSLPGYDHVHRVKPDEQGTG